jgi:hypothetical protein
MEIVRGIEGAPSFVVCRPNYYGSARVVCDQQTNRWQIIDHCQLFRHRSAFVVGVSEYTELTPLPTASKF